MKLNIYTLLFIFLSFGSMAQDTLSIDVTTYEKTAYLDDEDSGPSDIFGKVYLTNNKSTPVDIVWERTEVQLTEGWTSAVCDINQCYTPDVDTQEFTLAAGGVAEISGHAYPEEIIGSAHFKVVLYNKRNPSDREEVDFYFNLDQTVSLTALEKKALKIYPNPVIDEFKISKVDEVKEVIVYDLLGRPLYASTVSNNASHDISHLNKGLYLVQMLDENKEILKTVRLMKTNP